MDIGKESFMLPFEVYCIWGKAVLQLLILNNLFNVQ